MAKRIIKVPFEFVERKYAEDKNGRDFASVMIPENEGYPSDYHFMVYDFLVREQGGYYNIAFDTMYSNKYDFVKKHREDGKRYPRYTAKTLDEIARIYDNLVSRSPAPQLWLAHFEWYNGTNIGLGYCDNNGHFYPEGEKWNISVKSKQQVVADDVLILSDNDLLCPVSSDNAVRWNSIVHDYNVQQAQASEARLSQLTLSQILNIDFFEKNSTKNQYYLLRDAVNKALVDSISALDKGIDDMLADYRAKIEQLITELRESAEELSEDESDEDDILEL